MINLFDPPREKARKNIRILAGLIMLSGIVCLIAVIFHQQFLLVGGLMLGAYFAGAMVTLRNVRKDLKE